MVYGWNVNYFGIEILLDFANEELYIPYCVEWTFVAANQPEQMFAVIFAAIRHIWPLILESHAARVDAFNVAHVKPETRVVYN